MENPHFEDDAEAWHAIHVDEVSTGPVGWLRRS